MTQKPNILRVVQPKRPVIVDMSDNHKGHVPSKSENAGLNKVSGQLSSYRRVDADAEWSLFMSKVNKK